MAGITLRRYGTPIPPADRSSWVLRATALSTVPGLDSRIFVWHARASEGPTEGDICKAIASVGNMSNYPPDGPTRPGPQSVIPFYRTDSCLFRCDSAQEADDLWVEIQKQANSLVKNWVAATNLALEDEVDLEAPVR